MKITAFDDLYPLRPGIGSSVVYVASGSNGGDGGDAGAGGDVTGSAGDYTVVGLRQTVSLASNIGGGTVGDVLTIVQASPRLAMFATPSNSASADTIAIVAVFDGGGSALTTSQAVDIEVPFAATITQATLLADQSTSTVVAVWKDTYANFPPTIADAITGAAPPTITAASKAQDATLTGWTTSISAGDVLRISIASNTTATRATLSLRATR